MSSWHTWSPDCNAQTISGTSDLKFWHLENIFLLLVQLDSYRSILIGIGSIGHRLVNRGVWLSIPLRPTCKVQLSTIFPSNFGGSISVGTPLYYAQAARHGCACSWPTHTYLPIACTLCVWGSVSNRTSVYSVLCIFCLQNKHKISRRLF